MYLNVDVWLCATLNSSQVKRARDLTFIYWIVGLVTYRIYLRLIRLQNGNHSECLGISMATNLGAMENSTSYRTHAVQCWLMLVVSHHTDAFDFARENISNISVKLLSMFDKLKRVKKYSQCGRLTGWVKQWKHSCKQFVAYTAKETPLSFSFLFILFCVSSKLSHPTSLFSSDLWF